ncbi:diacylglycerol kinase family protein [Paenibacillus gorillae]|uniref:diacylglycerol kinase family protein n=1 Tax=Paenibacillus gorillae TaxID=1243662 RepID=UPI0004B5B60F|nr:diacylglycerol kinase family protein [Paenibacillus gorillae]
MLAKFIRSLGYAWSGIRFGIRTQRHVRFHLLAASVVSILASFLSLTRVEWAVLLLTFALVIAAELVNTAIEQAVDLASPGQHPVAKAAKDAAAGAVLVTAVAAVIIGLLIIGPPLWHILIK